MVKTNLKYLPPKLYLTRMSEEFDSFKYYVEGIIVPQISLVGFLANCLTIVVLHHSELKLKKSLVDILSGLATFDNFFLMSTFPMFTLTELSEW